MAFHGQTSKAGIFVLSIDVATPAARTNAAANCQLDNACDRLLTLLNDCRLPATWAVDEPAHWTFAKRLQSASLSHEIAILASAEWIGSAAGRSVFAQELGRRILAGRAAGLEVSTVVPHESAIDDHLDLLVQHEVSAVRGNVDLEARASRPAQPHPLHHGLWEMPGSFVLPRQSRWPLGGNGVWKARRGMRQAVVRSEVFHLVLDLAGLVEMGTKAERAVQRVLQLAAQWQESQELLAMTLAQAARHLTPVRNSASSRSILRAAG